MKATWLWAVAVAILTLAFSGCGDPRTQIAGKWKSTGQGNTMVWEFLENGTLLTGNTRGRYRFGDNKRIKIETPFATSVYQVAFSGDRMTWIDSKGSNLVFERVK